MYLTDTELVETTGYKRRSKQIAALAQMGVKFNIRPRDGKPLVLRDAPASVKSTPQPNFAAL